MASEAGFDYGVSFNPSHREFKGETSNPSFPNEQTTDSGTIGLNKAMRFGATYDLGLGFTRQEVAGQLEGLDKSYSATFDVSFTVPLIGGAPGTTAGRLATTETLVRAQGNLEISYETLRAEIHRVMVEVEDAYWNVVANMATLDTRRLALKRPRSDEVLAVEERIFALENKSARDKAEREELAHLREELTDLKRRQKAVPYIDPLDIRYNQFVPTVADGLHA